MKLKNKIKEINSHVNKAENYKKEGKLEEAITSYQKAIQLEPNVSPVIYVKLGDLLGETERFEEAMSCYQTASYKTIAKSHPDFVKVHWDRDGIRQPNFIIIGPPKTGTTSLYNYLIQHPQILPAIRKEIGVAGFKPFQKNLDLYLSHFPSIPKDSNFLTGEAGTGYFISTRQREKLTSLFPKVKLITMLRHPVDRVISHYNHNAKNGLEKRSLEEVIDSQLEATQIFIEKDGNVGWNEIAPAYLPISLYHHWLKKWMSVVPKEQLLILSSEEFFNSPSEVVKKVFSFLEVENYCLSEYKKYNVGAYKNSTGNRIKFTLSEFFKPHNKYLEEYLNRSFDWS